MANHWLGIYQSSGSVVQRVHAYTMNVSLGARITDGHHAVAARDHARRVIYMAVCLGAKDCPECGIGPQIANAVRCEDPIGSLPSA
jgi:hypothetical protein